MRPCLFHPHQASISLQDSLVLCLLGSKVFQLNADDRVRLFGAFRNNRRGESSSTASANSTMNIVADQTTLHQPRCGRISRRRLTESEERAKDRSSSVGRSNGNSTQGSPSGIRRFFSRFRRAKRQTSSSHSPQDRQSNGREREDRSRSDIMDTSEEPRVQRLGAHPQSHGRPVNHQETREMLEGFPCDKAAPAQAEMDSKYTEAHLREHLESLRI